MKLYIANLTRQNVEFAYRLPESTGVRTQHIPIGAQIRISGELSNADVDSIIEQHRKYGMIPAEEIKNKKGFAGLAYSVDKSVAAAGIEMALHSNTTVLLDRGKANRERVAVAANNMLERSLTESGIPGNLDHTDVTIVEDDRKNPTGEEGAPVAEALRVTRDESEPPRGRRKGGRKFAA